MSCQAAFACSWSDFLFHGDASIGCCPHRQARHHLKKWSEDQNWGLNPLGCTVQSAAMAYRSYSEHAFSPLGDRYVYTRKNGASIDRGILRPGHRVSAPRNNTLARVELRLPYGRKLVGCLSNCSCELRGVFVQHRGWGRSRPLCAWLQNSSSRSRALSPHRLGTSQVAGRKVERQDLSVQQTRRKRISVSPTLGRNVPSTSGSARAPPPFSESVQLVNRSIGMDHLWANSFVLVPLPNSTTKLLQQNISPPRNYYPPLSRKRANKWADTHFQISQV